MSDTEDDTEDSSLSDGVDSSLYWAVAQPMIDDGEAERGTMMGFPCLRIHGQFFASMHRETGDLVIKIPADRVDELIAAGEASPFAPAGRRFKEWAQISDRDEARWRSLVDEAFDFVSSGL